MRREFLLNESIENIQDGFLILDHEWHILYVNQQTADIVNKKLEDLKGKVLWEQYPDLLVTDLERAYYKAMEDQLIQRIEFKGILQDIWYSIVVFPIKEGIAVYWQDISKQKYLETQLKESEEKFHILIDSISEIFWETDADGRIVTEIPSWLTYTGQTREKSMNYGWMNAVHPDDQKTVEQKWQEAIASCGILDTEVRLKNVNGEWKWTSVYAAPIRDSEGKISKWVGINIDISRRKENERELLFQACLLESVHDAICAIDKNGIIIYWNSMAETILGWTSEEAIGQSAENIFKNIKEKMFRNIYAAEQYICEMVMRRKDGKIVDLDTHMHLLRNEKGEIIGRIASLRDITKRKEYERALKKKEQELLEIIDSSSEGSFIFNLEKNKTEISAEWASRLGMDEFSSKEAENILKKYVHPDDIPIVNEVILSAFKKKNPKFGIEIRVKTRDAGYIWILLQGKIIYNEEGLPVKFLGTQIDITARKQAEEDLQKSEERFRKVLEHSRDGINMLDLKTRRYTYLSPAQIEMTGFEGEEIRDISLEECSKRVHPDDRQMALEQYMRIVSGLDVCSDIEYRWKVKSGEYRWFSNKCKLVRDDLGRPVAMVGIGRDVTDSKKSEMDIQALVEKLQKADQNKNKFLSMLSHELRNPLASIMMSLSLLDHIEPGSEKSKNTLEIMKHQAAQLSCLLDDLLEITCINSNKIQLEKERMDLNVLIHHVIEDNRAQFTINGVELETELAPDPLFLEADPVRLTQVLSNLLHNAAKFTAKGEKTLVKVEKDKEQNEVVISVCDTGKGIPPELQSDLFQPFVQLDNSLPLSHGGLGLGLFVVKEMVELHGGSVSAFSEGLGKGSRFSIRLPLLYETDSKDEEVPLMAEPVSCARRILVIDDNANLNKVMGELLKLLGHEVMSASSGSDGIEKAKGFYPEIILCDIGMPGMDGYEVAKNIRNDQELKGVFLIALSGYAQPDDLERSKAAGFDRHLAKPVDLVTLENIIKEAPALG